MLMYCDYSYSWPRQSSLVRVLVRLHWLCCLYAQVLGVTSLAVHVGTTTACQYVSVSRRSHMLNESVTYVQVTYLLSARTCRASSTSASRWLLVSWTSRSSFARRTNGPGLRRLRRGIRTTLLGEENGLVSVILVASADYSIGYHLPCSERLSRRILSSPGSH